MSLWMCRDVISCGLKLSAEHLLRGLLEGAVSHAGAIQREPQRGLRVVATYIGLVQCLARPFTERFGHADASCLFQSLSLSPDRPFIWKSSCTPRQLWWGCRLDWRGLRRSRGIGDSVNQADANSGVAASQLGHGRSQPMSRDPWDYPLR